ncbi:L,D-transpeptidase [Enterococcus sp. LJL99]
MNNNDGVTRTSRSQTTGNGKKKASKNGKKLLVPIAIVLIILALTTGGGAYAYFQSHFLPTAKAGNTSIGWLSVKDAKQKLEDQNNSGELTIKMANREEKIQFPERYEITEEFLTKELNKTSITLPENQKFKEELTNSINAITFDEGTPSQDARIEQVDGNYQIVPEQNGTVVDKEALINQISTDVEQNKVNTVYEVQNFYEKPKVLKDNKELTEKLALMSKKENKKITLDINGEKVEIAKDEILSFMNENGDVDGDKVYAWVEQVNQQRGSIFKPITFTNVHGETLQYTNNGSYGWDINMPQTRDLIIQALNSDKAVEEIVVPIDGDATQSNVVNKDYVEVDLNDQKMYFFKNGVKVVETDVITGRYNKGTATVPGFHTILYKQTDTKLEGSMLDGSKYSVPVKYWMPLKSLGGVITQIGIHDSDKGPYFGNKTAYQTDAGSNGCINTPIEAVTQIFNEAYPGMAVIIYGHIYDSAPGEFDKPVEYGTPV